MRKSATQQSYRSRTRRRPSVFARLFVERASFLSFEALAKEDARPTLRIERKLRRTGLRRAQSSRCPRFRPSGVVPARIRRGGSVAGGECWSIGVVK
jgi:hypothetical protein